MMDEWAPIAILRASIHPTIHSTKFSISRHSAIFIHCRDGGKGRDTSKCEVYDSHRPTLKHRGRDIRNQRRVCVRLTPMDWNHMAVRIVSLTPWCDSPLERSNAKRQCKASCTNKSHTLSHTQILHRLVQHILWTCILLLFLLRFYLFVFFVCFHVNFF